MTKQEEIREGIAKTIPPLDCVHCIHFGYCAWGKYGLCEARHELADSIRNYLHSQGVVITTHGFYSDLMEPLIKE